jgi:hypothetical protein
MTDLATTATTLPGIEWVAPPGQTFDEFTEIGRKLAQVNRAAGFLLGDWVNHGEQVYGERFAQAADATGYDPATLRNFASVAWQIPSARRREELTFGHHQAVIGIKDETRRDELLERAASDGMTVERLRTEAKAYRTAQEPSPIPVAEPPVQFSEPPGYERAVEQVRSAVRALASMTGAQRVTAVWLVDAPNQVDVVVDEARQ